MIEIPKISPSKIVYTLVVVSLCYFLVKGIQYLIIGSYVPMLFILFALGLLIWSYNKSGKTHRKALRFWAIVILLWASVRILLWGYLQIDTKFTESHLREQFSLFQNAISIIMLVIGIQILKKTKHLKNDDDSTKEKE